MTTDYAGLAGPLDLHQTPTWLSRPWVIDFQSHAGAELCGR